MVVSRITIANGGPTFSRIAQGFGSAMQWKKGSQEVLEHVSECVDLGITTLDIAAVYGGGRAERLLGDALALNPSLRRRNEVVRASWRRWWQSCWLRWDHRGLG